MPSSLQQQQQQQQSIFLPTISIISILITTTTTAGFIYKYYYNYYNPSYRQPIGELIDEPQHQSQVQGQLPNRNNNNNNNENDKNDVTLRSSNVTTSNSYRGWYEYYYYDSYKNTTNTTLLLYSSSIILFTSVTSLISVLWINNQREPTTTTTKLILSNRSPQDLILSYQLQTMKQINLNIQYQYYIQMIYRWTIVGIITTTSIIVTNKYKTIFYDWMILLFKGKSVFIHGDKTNNTSDNNDDDVDVDVNNKEIASTVTSPTNVQYSDQQSNESKHNECQNGEKLNKASNINPESNESSVYVVENQKHQQTIVPSSIISKISEIDSNQSTNSQDEKNDTSNTTTNNIKTTTTSSNNIRTFAKYKYLEILVHNVSHTDLVLGLNVPETIVNDTSQSTKSQSTQSTRTIMYSDSNVDNDDFGNSPYIKNYIRPRFSSFDLYCRLVLDHVQQQHTRHHNLNTNTEPTTINKVEDVNHEINTANTTNPDTSSRSPITIIHFPRYLRSMSDPRYSIRQWQDKSTSKNYTPPKMAPTGIELTTSIPLPSTTAISSSSVLASCPIEDTIRIRGRDATTILSAFKQCNRNDDDIKANAQDTQVSIKYVFFPLLATLLPVWYRQINEKEYRQPVKRVLILVTGVGTPRNYTHSIHGNSTEACADLMKEFISQIDPSLTVVTVHSNTTNIFRSDENILFCERDLMPMIHAYRNAHVLGTPYPDDPDYQPIIDETSIYFDDDTDWRTTLHVTLSFADGSPARTQAIQSSLRPYKPTYFHFWQLKTFWHESKIVDDDIEVHSFATMESIPAIDTHQIRDPYIQAVVSEMRAFYDEMINALTNNDNDIDRFWLRKSHKPVLAVLLVLSSDTTKSDKQIATSNFRLHRGTNMEVSMPTGSLCAERNAIGSALAMNPNLKRHDLKMIAVLAVPPLGPIIESIPTTISSSRKPPLSIVAPATSATTKSASAKGGSQRTNENIHRVTSYSSILEESLDPIDDDIDNDNVQSIDHTLSEYKRKMSIGSDYEPTTSIEISKTNAWTKSDAANDTSTITPSFCLPVNDELDESSRDEKVGNASSKHFISEPVRRIPLFPKAPSVIASNIDNNTISGHGSLSPMKKKTKRTVVVQSQKDMNPLSPCGACNEWLKKIAQCNPYFKIITFTDANCNGMYISPCHD